MSDLAPRRRFLQVSSIAALALTGHGALRAQKTLPPGRVTIAVGGRGLLGYLPVLVAEQLGYFRDEGLAVTVRDFASGHQALHAMQQGMADVCAGIYEHVLLQALQGGAPLRAFVQLTRSPQMALGVSVKGLPRYRSVQDLRGRRIGVPAPGSYAQGVATALLARAGIAAGDVSFVGVGSGKAALQAVRTGKVHALCHADPLITMLEQRGDLKLVHDLRLLKGEAGDLFAGVVLAHCLFAPQTYLQSQSERASALAYGMVHALKWLQTASPGDLVKLLPEEYLLGDRGAYLAAYNKVSQTFSPHGAMPDNGPTSALRALHTVYPGLSSLRIDLNRTYTNEWVRKARIKYNV